MREENSIEYQQAIQRHDQVQQRLVSMMVLACIACIWLAFKITANLRRQLGGEPDEAADMMRQLASGDLQGSQKPAAACAPDSLMGMANTMTSRLSRILAHIHNTVSTVNVAAASTADNSRELNQRTLQQLQALIEGSASIEQLAAGLHANNAQATHALTLVQQTCERAEQGLQMAGKTMQAMHDIEADSRRITDIIGIIDTLAFNTNLLALNAAIEAAHAGQHGASFAVVAGEVRKLASRSAEAAQSIRDLIGEASKKVAMGSELAQQTGSVLHEMAHSARQVSVVFADLALSHEEHHAGIEQLRSAIHSLESTSNHNTSLADQTSLAAMQLADSTRQLVAELGFFRIRTLPDEDELLLSCVSR